MKSYEWCYVKKSSEGKYYRVKKIQRKEIKYKEIGVLNDVKEVIENREERIVTEKITIKRQDKKC